MRRLQVMIESDLDEELNRRSAEEGTSKAALIRRYVRSALQPVAPLEEDPLAGMVGADEYEPAPVDEVVYR
jgi:metal-responsive CopG/Arc/MetJ family transcriptional regulator